MSDLAVQEVIETLFEPEHDTDDTTDCELLHFLVRSLRGDVQTAATAAHGILKLMQDPKYRRLLQSVGVEAAVKGLHFCGSDMSDLATKLAQELEQEPMLYLHDNSWKTFSLEGRQTVRLQVKLSAAADATRLSSHGWRVWPGAQILSQWFVSEFSTLQDLLVIEAGVTHLRRPKTDSDDGVGWEGEE